tara:strand:+ start:355 stop:534 length:180 start_codon:yes stop_codon:yes gene_type:complete
MQADHNHLARTPMVIYFTCLNLVSIGNASYDAIPASLNFSACETNVSQLPTIHRHQTFE